MVENCTVRFTKLATLLCCAPWIIFNISRYLSIMDINYDKRTRSLK